MSQSSSSRTWGTILIVLVISAVAALNLITKKSLEGVMNFVSQIQQKVSGRPNIEKAGGVLLRLKVKSDGDASSSQTSGDQDHDEALKATVKVIRRRLDMLGFSSASLEIQSDDSVLAKIPGPVKESSLELLTKDARLSFHTVDAPPPVSLKTGFLKDPAPDDFEKIVDQSDPARSYRIHKANLISSNGFDLVEAGVDRNTRQPVLRLKFNTETAKQFAVLTKSLVGKQLAIVLQSRVDNWGDSKRLVLAAPLLQTPILNGEAHITGQFSHDEAMEIAVLLATGPLPARVEVVEKRTVAPKTGADPPKTS